MVNVCKLKISCLILTKFSSFPGLIFLTIALASNYFVRKYIFYFVVKIALVFSVSTTKFIEVRN